ncbi:ATP-binding protein [Sorangium atrum]|uniref:Histidine kinase/HSP90-like ATPase domain-containing protein n=1 Tax=Sorangium atrum TaxID=2995308 RepID=A0ABT5CET2_9BACT|nr:ATP-binding protein [Sorangium aterium]MDC0684945.1 hypothetical protein [Sorangium aterium]
MRGVSGKRAARARAARAGRTDAAPSGYLPEIFLPWSNWLGDAHSTSTPPRLGLFIVKSIVDAHRGSIQVTSTLEEGTAFRVKLPRSS